MERVGIVVLSKNEKYLDALMNSLFMLEANWRETCQIVIGSDGLSDHCKDKYRSLGISVLEMPPHPFIYARNANICIESLDPGINFMLLNDDTTFQTFDPVSTMAEIFKNDCISPEGFKYALICPAIHGAVGNLGQTVGFVETDKTMHISGTMSFVAAMFSREAWDKVGKLDESFVGYGYEDDDWCIRAENAGYHFAVTQKVYLNHGCDGYSGSSSWKQTGLDFIEENEKNKKIFFDKWPNAREKRARRV